MKERLLASQQSQNYVHRVTVYVVHSEKGLTAQVCFCWVRGSKITFIKLHSPLCGYKTYYFNQRALIIHCKEGTRCLPGTRSGDCKEIQFYRRRMLTARRGAFQEEPADSAV
uniref:Uncharacterized protein n=1 Tax=Anguilla anguilla TaxID=7936 RepID=A0A0E9W6L6_ANGAN